MTSAHILTGLGLTTALAARSQLLNGRPTRVTIAGRLQREDSDPEARATIKEQVMAILGGSDQPDPSRAEGDQG